VGRRWKEHIGYGGDLLDFMKKYRKKQKEKGF
jgi:hypothetical protein